MYVFLFTDIEGSSKLWEEHTAVMTGVIARHDEILGELITDNGGRITKHTGDGITAVFDAGQPLACALEAQVRFAAEPWTEIGTLPIRAGLHAGEAEFHASAGTTDGDYFGPPVNATARVMSAAWGGQILLTPEVTQASPLPDRATLLDLGQHLLKNVSAPQQLCQLLHPDLARHEFPPPRTLSGQSIRQAVGERGGQIAGLEPGAMGIALLSATLGPALQGELDPESGALEGNLGILEDLGAVSLRGFVAAFAGRLRAAKPLPAREIQSLLHDQLLVEWQGGGETALALRSDASRLLQAVHGVEAAMAAATDEVKEALARGLADLGSQFGEFRWMLAGVQETLAEMRAQHELQLSLQREQLAKTEEILRFQREQVRLPVADYLPDAGDAPAFLEADEGPYEEPIFVARERELARLDGFLRTALAGQGCVVFVTGGPGRGKTALMGEFSRRAMEVYGDLLVASGNCNAYSGVGDPYLPFREVMGMLSGDVEARWVAGAITSGHARRLWGALPLTAQALLDHGPHVTGTLVRGQALLSRSRAAAPEGAPWLERLRERVERQTGGSEGLEQSHLFQQLTHVLRGLAEHHPLLLVLDDLQWTDTASASLLFHLGRRLEGSRILVVGTYRPEEVALARPSTSSGVPERHPLAPVLAEFKRTLGDIWLDLAEVQEPEGRAFVDALLATEPNRLGEGFRRSLFGHTGGHPLFTVELLRAMQERGDLVQDDTGHWVEGAALDWGALPARVEGVIEARIGRLEEELRETLSVASVEGEDFTAQVVARVQAVSERRLLRTLSRELERRHRLVRGRGEEQVGRQRLSRYRFAHALFQQYLYSDLSPGECRLLHQEIAGALEELHEGDLEEVAAPLAHHFSEAGDEVRALKYLILAGDGALGAYANREAVAHYRRALELARTEAERAYLLAGLGEALNRLGSVEEALQAMRKGIGLYNALGDLDGVAGLYSRLSWVMWWTGDHAGALRVCEQGLESVSGAPESREQAQLLHEVARTFYFALQPEKARPLCQRALEMAGRLGAVDVEADALATWGVLPNLTPQEGLEALRRAADLAEEAGFLHLASRAHNNLATLWSQRLGDNRPARQHAVRVLALEQRAGDIGGEIFSLWVLIFEAVPRGDLGEAAAHLLRMRRLAGELDDPGTQFWMILHSEAQILCCRGDWANAARLARESLFEHRRLGDRFYEAFCSAQPAEALLEAHFAAREPSVCEWDEAERALTRALEIFEALPDWFEAAWCRCLLSVLLASRGRFEEARSYLEEAMSVARQRPQTRFEAAVLWAEGRLSMAEAHWPEAQAAFEAMVGLNDQLGLHWHWARGLMDWAGAHAARGEPGDRERAAELLREAQAAFEEMGADGYVEVVEHKLAALSGEVNAGPMSPDAQGA